MMELRRMRESRWEDKKVSGVDEGDIR